MGKNIITVCAVFFTVCFMYFCSAEDMASAQPESGPGTVAEEAAPAVQDKYDFSDLSSWNLTVSAWEKMAEKDYEGVAAYTDKCFSVYNDEAGRIAAEMRKFAGPGHEDDYAVVNDVATCHYILGETYMRLGKNDDAVREFEIVIKEYPYAQCWDPKGWFWKVADISKTNIAKIRKAGVKGK
ncbi:MAG: hypothetical protein ABH885_06325 [Candidatus Omnitrophota bacterium]